MEMRQGEGEGLLQSLWLLIALLTEPAALLLLRTGRPILHSRPAAAFRVSVVPAAGDGPNHQALFWPISS